MASMRKYFFDRFGAGEPEGLVERTKHYLLGMPGKDGEMFPPRCNMETASLSPPPLAQAEAFALAAIAVVGAERRVVSL